MLSGKVVVEDKYSARLLGVLYDYDMKRLTTATSAIKLQRHTTVGSLYEYIRSKVVRRYVRQNNLKVTVA